MDKLNVVFHIDEMSKWDLVLKNAKNFIASDHLTDVVILANAEAVKGLLRESEYESEIGFLLGEDVEFKVCANALRDQKLDQDALISAVEVVAAGVVELVLLQNEGYRYIKP